MSDIGNRTNQLRELGLQFSFQYDSYVKDDYNVHWTEVALSSDEEWDNIVSNIKNEMERRANV